jgi:ribosomal protein S8
MPRKRKQPKDPEGLNRLLTHLSKAGWIDNFIEIDATKNQNKRVHVNFSKKGLRHIAAFKALHDDLGDISETDRHLLYDYLMIQIFNSLKKHGEL